jgi:acyl-CoA thioesterase I
MRLIQKIIQTSFILLHRRVLSYGSPIRPHSGLSTARPFLHPLRADGAPRLGHPPDVTLKLSLVLVIYFLLLFLFLGGSGYQASAAPADDGRTASVSGNERVIVAFGDSLTAGLGVSAADAYPAVLARKIKEAGYPYRVINAGVSGETTAGGLRRVSMVLEDHPEIVILELGANDGLRGLGIGQIEKNLATIIELLREKKVQIVLAGMKLPPNYGKEYTGAFEGLFPKLAARYHLTLIPFFLDGVAARSTLNQPDGIHPTAQGYRVIVDRLWPEIEALLKK